MEGKVQKKGFLTYIDKGDYAICMTRHGIQFLIDTEDIDRICHIRWRANGSPAGTRIIGTVDGKRVYLYRYILGIDDDRLVDHIFGNTLDNRKSKLRETDATGNSRNKLARSEYGVNGVRETSSGKFVAHITVDYVTRHLGTFPTLEDAIAARLKAEEELFGRFSPKARYQRVAMG